MNLIIYAHNSFNIDILKEKLESLGHNVVLFDCDFSSFTIDPELASKLIGLIHSNNADGVISFNYYPFMSLICEACEAHYYSWVYDAPHSTLYSKALLSPFTHIGVFDKSTTDFFNQAGIDNIFHLPLAVDSITMSKRIANASKNFVSKNGSPDISFVGSLYTDLPKVNLYDFFKNEDIKRNSNLDLWNDLDCRIRKYIFNNFHSISESDSQVFVETLLPYMNDSGMLLGPDYFDLPDLIIKESVIEKKITVEERRSLFTSISKLSDEKKYDFRLFTNSPTESLPDIQKHVCSSVDYITEMPYVFSKSKININVTLRSIHSGIPLRILDILGCGGFLLTNPQPELLESFTVGKDFETFTSIDECLDKIRFYLLHEELRKKLSTSGKEKVSKLFTYENALSKLLNFK